MHTSVRAAGRFGLALTASLWWSCSSHKGNPNSAAPPSDTTTAGNAAVNGTAGSPAGIGGTAGSAMQTTQTAPTPDAGRTMTAKADASAGAGTGAPDAAAMTETPQSSNWPSYGRDDDNTRYASQEKMIGVDTVAKLKRKWSWTGSGVTSTPAVVDGVVYFGDWKGTLHAVQAADGKEIWATSLQSGSGLAQLNDSPLVTDDTVYIGGSSAQLFAVDKKTGKQLWDPGVTLDMQQQTMLWSSPILAGDVVVTGIGSYAVFLGGSFRGSTVAVDAKSGKSKWQTYVVPDSGQGVSVWSSAAYDASRKMVYIGTGQTYALPASPYSDSVIALDRDSGKIAWVHQYTMDDAFSLSSTPTGHDFDVGAAPNLLLENGRVLVGAGDKGGRYLALDRETGDMVWEQMLTPGGRNGGVMGSAAYAEGVIYLTSNTGEPTSLVGAGGPPASSAFALKASSGEILWKTDLPDGSFGAVTYANGVAFATTIDGVLYAFNGKDGKILWMDKMGDSAAGGISVVDGVAYVGNGWEWLPTGSLAGGLIAYGLP